MSLSKLRPTFSDTVLSIDTLVSSWILVLVIANEFHKLLHSPFLKNAHQWRSDGLSSILEGRGRHLHLVGGDFGYSALAVDVASCDLLEFEITRDIRVLISVLVRGYPVPQGCLLILRLP